MTKFAEATIFGMILGMMILEPSRIKGVCLAVMAIVAIAVWVR
jgi:hypothetical protein